MTELLNKPEARANGVASYRFDNAKRRRPDHHVRQAMLTPGYVLEPLRTLLGGIGLDPCTESNNPTGAARFYHLPMDGCRLPWDAETVFCNPPYGEARNRWVDRCIEVAAAGRKVVLLIPAHTDTKSFQRAMENCTSILFVRARLRFGVLRESGRQEAASHGSALIGFNVDLSPLGVLGKTFPGPSLLVQHSQALASRIPDGSAANLERAIHSGD